MLLFRYFSFILRWYPSVLGESKHWSVCWGLIEDVHLSISTLVTGLKQTLVSVHTCLMLSILNTAHSHSSSLHVYFSDKETFNSISCHSYYLPITLNIEQTSASFINLFCGFSVLIFNKTFHFANIQSFANVELNFPMYKAGIVVGFISSAICAIERNKICHLFIIFSCDSFSRSVTI